MSNRKEIINEYKQNPPEAGIYKIINNVTGQYSLGSSLNLKGVENKFNFGKNTGLPNVLSAKINAECLKYGIGNFNFEIVRILDRTPGMTDSEAKDELEVLLDLTREELGADNEF